MRTHIRVGGQVDVVKVTVEKGGIRNGIATEQLDDD